MKLETHWIGPGPEEAPSLIFLHDGLGAAGSWKGFAPDLAAALGCGALVYSRAGYGSSGPAPFPRPVEFMHDEALVVLPEILEKHGIRRAILVGHSDGASISLVHAARSTTRDRVLALAQGEEDEFGTVRQVESIASRVAGPVETVLLPGCGHSPHFQRREETLAAMTAFLRKHLAS